MKQYTDQDLIDWLDDVYDVIPNLASDKEIFQAIRNRLQAMQPNAATETALREASDIKGNLITKYVKAALEEYYAAILSGSDTRAGEVTPQVESKPSPAGMRSAEEWAEKMSPSLDIEDGSLPNTKRAILRDAVSIIRLIQQDALASVTPPTRSDGEGYSEKQAKEIYDAMIAARPVKVAE